MLKSKANHSNSNTELNPERHNRRSLLRLDAGMTAGSGLALPSAYAKQLKAQESSLASYNLNTGESWASTYWIQGQYLKERQNEINNLLRDHRPGDTSPIDRHLLDLLYLIKLTVGSPKPFHIISGYRSPKANPFLRKARTGVAEKSLHMEGRRLIYTSSYDLSQLRQVALSLRAGGVGYYTAYNFIHVYVG